MSVFIVLQRNASTILYHKVIFQNILSKRHPKNKEEEYSWFIIFGDYTIQIKLPHFKCTYVFCAVKLISII